MEQNKQRESVSKKEPNKLPATEVVKNPNPRANENIQDPKKTPDKTDTLPGSEITDGEDG